MGKKLFIAEKPSVAQEFARTLGVKGGDRRKGWLEDDSYVITWCYGHLVTMSYPEAYDPKFRKWSFDTLPFLPETFRYEVIPASGDQFRTVSSLLMRDDVSEIYVCTDSGREGEYIYRLVEMMCGPSVGAKVRRRVWIDSFTDEEIRRGIAEAKPLSDYDHLSDAAFLRAKEDYLMGINFSRVLTLKYGGGISDFRNAGWSAIAVGRVMTCVLGMVVRREREIRSFVKQPFYRVAGTFDGITAEWKAVPGSLFHASPKLYRENGFREYRDAETLIWNVIARAAEGGDAKSGEPEIPGPERKKELLALLKGGKVEGTVLTAGRKTEKKNPPLLYNLAELQNDCSRMFHISPDQTLKVAQELYEKKLTTYPRTDARVLSSAVAKEISKNISGLRGVDAVKEYAEEVLAGDSWKKIGKSRYTDDKAITDHYAIIPTGSGLGALKSLSDLTRRIYETICRRFLAIFYLPAVYEKTSAEILCGGEHFFVGARELKEEGYLKLLGKGRQDAGAGSGSGPENGGGQGEEEGEDVFGTGIAAALKSLRKGKRLSASAFKIREGETSPPKRYTSGSMILAMENAGQLIEDDSLREQIRGSGIGTSATRAEILAKLVRIGYLSLNKKTQVITPELLGEMVYDVVDQSIRPLLSAELTASWEKGLTKVADGSISTEEYLKKLEDFVSRRTNGVKRLSNQDSMRQYYEQAAAFYKKGAAGKAGSGRKSGRKASAGRTGRKGKNYEPDGTGKNQ